METIAISNRFFQHDLDTYSDWKKAFWRELVQNSVDARARRLDFTIEKLEGGGCKATLQDNGPGMTEETLRNVYFRLGETTKEGKADQIGGHGRARILTCFAHESYSIHTQKLQCSGKGGQFEISYAKKKNAGCRVEVTINQADAYDMESSLRNYLSTCQISSYCTINGAPFSDWLYRRRATRQVSFGTLHVTRVHPRRLMVRVNGVCMFEQYISCPVGIILEVEPEKARDILTISRDNLKYSQAQELSALCAEVAVDNTSIQRDCLHNKTQIFGNLKRFARKAEDDHNSSPASSPFSPSPDTNTEQQYGSTHASTMGLSSLANTSTERYQHGTGGDPDTGAPLLEFSFATHFEDASKVLQRAAGQFQPTTIRGKRLKMLKAWNAAVEFFLETIAEVYTDDLTYLTGFLFSGKSEAMHIQHEGQGHLILIAPVTSTGKLAYSVQDHAKLYALALHECTHIIHKYHDEDFAATQTELAKRTLSKYNQFRARVRSAARISDQ